jgi:hypothetical protein
MLSMGPVILAEGRGPMVVPEDETGALLEGIPGERDSPPRSPGLQAFSYSPVLTPPLSLRLTSIAETLTGSSTSRILSVSGSTGDREAL